MEVAAINEIKKTYSYNEYRNLVVSLADSNGCTGESTESHIDATHINAQRMKRIDKQCEIDDELRKIINGISKKCTWLALVESWCGDAAQCIPAVAKMAELNPNIELKLILRDENPEVMDAFLTNNARSIPKLVFIQDGNVVGTWGPRPLAIQNRIAEFKKANPNVSYEEFVANLHLWYAKDRTQSIQNDFKDLLRTY